MVIIGVSAYYHDSAVALIRDGDIVACAQEERFTRNKHDPAFPRNALRYCLDEAGIDAADVDKLAFYDKPFLKFERLLETYLTFAPRGFSSFRMAMPVWLREKLFLKDLLARELAEFDSKVAWSERLLFGEHHLSHAASAFYPSPFDEAVVLTLDGVGEWATTSVAIGSANSLEVQREIHFPHSLGLLYSAFTYYTGFKVNSGEYKLMGLAPYGEPRYTNQIRDKLIDIKPDGSFRLNLDYFDYCTGLRMTNDRFATLFGGAPRRANEQITQRHMDLAASVQQVVEEVMLKLTASLAAETQIKNLCLAGGVALNCVANGKVLRQGSFDRVWVQPAAGDAGGALGAALSTWYGFLGLPRPQSSTSDRMQGGFLGPQYAQDEIERRLNSVGARLKSSKSRIYINDVLRTLQTGKRSAGFRGRMEFGPRALGGRSILADPRSPSMQRTLNLKVKQRESFRPFAPSVLREDVAEWFELDTDSPYMLFVADVQTKRRMEATDDQKTLTGIDKLNVARSQIPAVTHVDYSARIQTVDEDSNPRYHALLSCFKELTGCPVLVNTSFNVRGEPIVRTPEDAFRCFMSTGIDVLAIGQC